MSSPDELVKLKTTVDVLRKKLLDDYRLDKELMTTFDEQKGNEANQMRTLFQTMFHGKALMTLLDLTDAYQKYVEALERLVPR